MVAAVVVSDLVVIGVVAAIFYYLYRRAVSSKERERETKGGLKERKDGSSEDMGQTNLIPLDRQVNFSLNELLQSSAFVLGKSEFGIVYKVVMDDGFTVAVRRLGEGGSQRFKEFQREVEAVGRVRHPNIVALRAYYWSTEEKLLIYDYIPAGNLSTAIHGRDGDSTFSPMLWSSRLKIMKGIAKGLAFLHEFSPKKYIHGDLKPNNVLLGLNMMPYISDFGLARLAYIAEGSTPEIPQNQFSDAAVSPVTNSRLCYHAPEAFRTTKPSQKWDIYSFGVILLELISGQSPVLLLDTREMDLVQWFQFCISKRKPLVDVLDPYLAQEPEIEDEIISVLKIALACVESNPERRPAMKRVAETLERLVTIS